MLGSFIVCTTICDVVKTSVAIRGLSSSSSFASDRNVLLVGFERQDRGRQKQESGKNLLL